MTLIVSSKISAVTLWLFIQKLFNYEYGITKFIEELCGVYKNENVEEWINHLNNFILKRRNILPDYQCDQNVDYVVGIDAYEGTNCIVYVGNPIKNRIIQSHNDYLRKKKKLIAIKRECQEYEQSQEYEYEQSQEYEYEQSQEYEYEQSQEYEHEQSQQHHYFRLLLLDKDV
jgi:hypothetical protein